MMHGKFGARSPRSFHRPIGADLRCGGSEEAAAALALGTLEPGAALEYRRHLAACAECAGLVREWEELLRPRPAMVRPVPPSRLKRRVMRSAAFAVLSRRIRTRSRAVMAAAAAVMLLVGALGIWQWSSPAAAGGTAERTAVIRTAERGTPVFPEPVYRQYSARAEPARLGQAGGAGGQTPASAASGYVWLSDRGDMLIFVDGIPPRADADYQVWSVLEGRMENLGILVQWERMAYLYVQNADPTRWEAIAVSLEPRGGSQLPTGPEAITVRFD